MYKEAMYYVNKTIEEIIESKHLAVFGAGAVAEAVVNCLMDKPYELQIAYCVVSDLQGNPARVAGVPVISLSDARDLLPADTKILVAVAEKNLESVRKSLSRWEQFSLIFLNYEGDLWSLIRGNYYREQRLAQHAPYLTLEEELQENAKSRQAVSQIRIYTARSHVDRVLKENRSVSWETPIQAGAALTEHRICSLCDNQGENISHKNRQYCELTALYWIWKHDTSDYVGLQHYRRYFEVDETQLRRLCRSDIDVVLTIPILDFPSVEATYRRDHIGEDWDVMMEAIRELQPEYLPMTMELSKGRFYYAYNMFIMRRAILEAYCAWLFPILEYCETHCSEKKDTYQNRYIGFLAEHLMAIYFGCHENDYKIVHARKHFIES